MHEQADCMDHMMGMGPMMDMGGMMGMGWMMMLSWLLLIVGIVGIVALVTRIVRRPHEGEQSASQDSPLTLLQSRYARGEIDTQEYEQIRDQLRRDGAR